MMLRMLVCAASAILLSVTGTCAQAGDNDPGYIPGPVKIGSLKVTMPTSDQDEPSTPQGNLNQTAPVGQAHEKRPPMVLFQWGNKFPR
jgi:hypothetical protein